MTRVSDRARIVVAALAIGVTGLGLTGCAGYATYPPASGQIAANDPNGRIVERAMAVALREAIDRYPPPAELMPRDAGTAIRPHRIAVNLLPGLTPENAERVTSQIGPDVIGLWSQSADLPTYHVSRVWLRGGRASVDVFHPVVTRRGERTTQMVTYDLSGGLTTFRVERTREWAVGAFEPPEAFEYTPTEVLAARAAEEEARRAAEAIARREAEAEERRRAREAERQERERERERQRLEREQQQTPAPDPDPEPQPEPTPDPETPDTPGER